MCTGRCRQILSIVVPMIFDEVQLRAPIRGNEVRFCLLNFPHQACRGKLEDKEILCFLLNFTHQACRGKLEDKAGNPLFSTKFPGEI